MGSVSLGDKVSRSPVSERILQFLDTQLNKKPREVEQLVVPSGAGSVRLPGKTMGGDIS